jgi:hypothetical protein
MAPTNKPKKTLDGEQNGIFGRDLETTLATLKTNRPRRVMSGSVKKRPKREAEYWEDVKAKRPKPPPPPPPPAPKIAPAENSLWAIPLELKRIIAANVSVQQVCNAHVINLTSCPFEIGSIF